MHGPTPRVGARFTRREGLPLEPHARARDGKARVVDVLLPACVEVAHPPLHVATVGGGDGDRKVHRAAGGVGGDGDAAVEEAPAGGVVAGARARRVPALPVVVRPRHSGGGVEGVVHDKGATVGRLHGARAAGVEAVGAGGKNEENSVQGTISQSKPQSVA